MSESELIKQVKAIRSPDGGFIFIDDLIDVLDEAKADFPEPQDQTFKAYAVCQKKDA